MYVCILPLDVLADTFDDPCSALPRYVDLQINEEVEPPQLDHYFEHQVKAPMLKIMHYETSYST